MKRVISFRMPDLIAKEPKVPIYFKLYRACSVYRRYFIVRNRILQIFANIYKTIIFFLLNFFKTFLIYHFFVFHRLPIFLHFLFEITRILLLISSLASERILFPSRYSCFSRSGYFYLRIFFMVLKDDRIKLRTCINDTCNTH